MGAFSKQVQRFPPERVELVPASAFADDWEPKRKGMLGDPVPVGIRIISDGDASRARTEAERIADLFRPRDENPAGWIEAFNDALMRLGCAFGTCRADDSSQPFFQLAEDTVRQALTSEGARYIWLLIRAHEAAKSPLWKPADTNDVARLANLARAGAFEEAGEMGIDVRRLIARAIVELEGRAPKTVARLNQSSGIHTEDEELDGVPVVTIKATRKR